MRFFTTRVARRAALAVFACLVTVFALLPTTSPAKVFGPLLPSVDPFYKWTGSLNGVTPGTVLRTRKVLPSDVTATPSVAAEQVLYRTTSELGQPIVTVATILRPIGITVSPGLVSYQTAYDALGDQCDPSYTLRGGGEGTDPSPDTDEEAIVSYLDAGYTVVTSDYEGEALDYGAGLVAGYSTLDAIQAAEHILSLAPARTPVGIVGYSGGSIATDFAAELASTYAPELDIVATALGGVPVDWPHNITYISGSSGWSGLIPALLVGLARASGVDLSPYLSAYGRQLTAQVAAECIGDFYGAYPGLTIGQLLRPAYQNWQHVPALVAMFNAGILGQTGTPPSPLLIGVGDSDGTGDGIMIDGDVQQLAFEDCQRGDSVQYTVYAGEDHLAAGATFTADAQTFLADRLAGIPVTDGCASIGPGNPLTPLARLSEASDSARLGLRGGGVDAGRRGRMVAAVF
jgi:hypothetical protein